MSIFFRSLNFYHRTIFRELRTNVIVFKNSMHYNRGQKYNTQKSRNGIPQRGLREINQCNINVISFGVET